MGVGTRIRSGHTLTSPDQLSSGTLSSHLNRYYHHPRTTLRFPACFILLVLLSLSGCATLSSEPGMNRVELREESDGWNVTFVFSNPQKAIILTQAPEPYRAEAWAPRSPGVSIQQFGEADLSTFNLPPHRPYCHAHGRLAIKIDLSRHFPLMAAQGRARATTRMNFVCTCVVDPYQQPVEQECLHPVLFGTGPLAGQLSRDFRNDFASMRGFM